MHQVSASISMIAAVFAMGALTLAMAAAQGVTRLWAMRRAGLALQDAAHTVDLDHKLPSTARRVNDNYNHLTEAPTVFYAVVLAAVAADLADPFLAKVVWAYVVLRLAHSIVQATINRVALRAAIYSASWLALALLIVVPLLRASSG